MTTQMIQRFKMMTISSKWEFNWLNDGFWVIYIPLFYYGIPAVHSCILSSSYRACSLCTGSPGSCVQWERLMRSPHSPRVTAGWYLIEAVFWTPPPVANRVIFIKYILRSQQNKMFLIRYFVFAILNIFVSEALCCQRLFWYFWYFWCSDKADFFKLYYLQKVNTLK